MKQIRVGIAAGILALATMLYACSKDQSTSGLQQADAALSAARARTAVAQNNGTPKPVLTASHQPAAAKKGNSVTITYQAKDPGTSSLLQCGTLRIYQLQGTEWVEVAVGAAPSLSYTFTADKVGSCAYQFRAGFAPGGSGVQCKGDYAGVDYTTQTPYCVEVTEPCVTAFTIDPEVSAVNIGGGVYEFTIAYTLSSPVDVQGVKFQGGATAGGNSNHNVTNLGTMTVVNDNRNNTVLKWEGDLTACTPKRLYFKYTRNFSCPATDAAVTGNWSASAGGNTLGEKAPLTYSCN